MAREVPAQAGRRSLGALRLRVTLSPATTRGDLAARYEAYSKAVGGPWMSRGSHLVAFAGACFIAAGGTLAGCGRDSYIPETTGPVAQVEFGDGIEVVTPAGTWVRLFADHVPSAHNGRPAIPLQDLIGADVVSFPDVYGYRFIGTDGYYANMPGKGYGDNTWAQLGIGYVDLVDVRLVFETARDPMLRKGHNVKYVIRVEVLRSIDVVWSDGRKLAPVAEVPPVTIPEGYPGAGAEGLLLADVVTRVIPADIVPGDHVCRVLARDGTGLPRLLGWEEMHAVYYLPGSDRVVMEESLGPAYQVEMPRSIRLEGGASRALPLGGDGE